MILKLCFVLGNGVRNIQKNIKLFGIIRPVTELNLSALRQLKNINSQPIRYPIMLKQYQLKLNLYLQNIKLKRVKRLKKYPIGMLSGHPKEHMY